MTPTLELGRRYGPAALAIELGLDTPVALS
jgi:hypothetical protein